MTLPVSPDPDTILTSCIETLRDVVVPNVEGEWPRYSADLLIGSLEYVQQLLREDLDPNRRAELRAALDELAPLVEAAGGSAFAEALAELSPFEAASRMLVASQNEPGELADRVRATLHPVLHRQLDAEMARSMGLFSAFARNMSGVK